jgi:hypothetical protein
MRTNLVATMSAPMRPCHQTKPRPPGVGSIWMNSMESYGNRRPDFEGESRRFDAK